MKILPCALLLAVCVCIDSVTIGSNSREKRRFKSSVADRIGHGFGKRQDSSLDSFYPSENPERSIMTTQQMAKLLQQNSALALIIVEKYVDLNGDGLINTDELLQRGQTRS